MAIPKPENGEMEIWSSTQNPSETQSYVAQVTGVKANKIVSRVKRLGGTWRVPSRKTHMLTHPQVASVARKLDPFSLPAL